MRLHAHSWVVALTLICGSALQAQAPSSQVRQVPMSGKLLQEVVLPGEKAVVVVSKRSRPHEVLPPKNTPAVDWMTRISDSVFVVFVQAIEPKLTHDETWITSRVTLSVAEVLKDSPVRPIRPGESVSFEQDGGTLAIDGTMVSAVVPWARPVQESRKYLVFAAVDKSTKELIFDNASSYEITPTGRLRKLLTAGPHPDQLEKATEEEVLARIRAHANMQ